MTGLNELACCRDRRWRGRVAEDSTTSYWTLQAESSICSSSEKLKNFSIGRGINGRFHHFVPFDKAICGVQQLCMIKALVKASLLTNRSVPTLPPLPERRLKTMGIYYRLAACIARSAGHVLQCYLDC